MASIVLTGTSLVNLQHQAWSQMGMGKMMMDQGVTNKTVMIGMGKMMMNPNMMGMMGMMNPTSGLFTDQNLTSSIKLLPAMMNGVHSQMKVSLSDAALAAQEEIGNSSQAVAANIGVEGGYLVYVICVVDPDMNLHIVMIDPGNGKVLLSQKVPMMQMINMMNPMMGGGMMNPMMSHMGHWQ
ncbi:MAG TPA: PepSY domain-containing protein [Nitrososphaeraceae archaeon]